MIVHCSAPQPFEALPDSIDTRRGRGYGLVTVSGLLKGDRRFVDVPVGTAACTAIGRVVEEGYMSGYNRDWFGPEDPIRRAQFAKVAVNVAGLHTDQVEFDAATFFDVPRLTDETGGGRAHRFD